MENVSLSRAEHISTESRFAVGWLQKKHPCLIIHQIEHAPNWFFHQVRREPQSAPVRFWSMAPLATGRAPTCCSWPSRNWLRNFVSEVLVVGSPNPPFLDPLLAGLSPELRSGFLSNPFFRPRTSRANCPGRRSSCCPPGPTPAPTRSGSRRRRRCRWWRAALGEFRLCHSGRKWDSLYTGQPGGICRGNPGRGRPPAFSRGLVTPSSLAASREYLSPARMAQSFFSAYQSVTGGKRLPTKVLLPPPPASRHAIRDGRR